MIIGLLAFIPALMFLTVLLWVIFQSVIETFTDERYKVKFLPQQKRKRKNNALAVFVSSPTQDSYYQEFLAIIEVCETPDELGEHLARLADKIIEQEQGYQRISDLLARRQEIERISEMSASDAMSRMRSYTKQDRYTYDN